MSVVVRRADAAISVLKQVKSSIIQMHGPEQSTPPTLIVWRGDRMVAFVHLSAPWDSMKLANVSEFVARGFRADCVALSFESWMVDASSQKDVVTNPDTGEEWGPGEMGDYVDRHGRGGVVKDALVVAVVTGDATEGRMVPFEPVRGSFGWSAKWLTPFEDQHGQPEAMTGQFMESLRSGVGAVPSLTETVLSTAAQHDVPLEVANADLDAAAASSLSASGVANILLCAEPDEVQRAQRLSERTGQVPVSSADIARAASARWN